MRQPSGLTKWLLENCVSQEALAGDLAEEYAAGRSSAWYVNQVLRAMVLDACSKIREDKLSAVRAVMVGTVLGVAWVSAFRLSPWWMTLQTSPEKMSEPVWWVVMLSGYAGIAWVIILFHPLPMLFVFLGFLLVTGALRDFGLWPLWLPSLGSPLSIYGPIACVVFLFSAILKVILHRRVEPSNITSHRSA